MTTDDGRLAKLYDRFDLLFYVTIVTVALLLLVDLEQEEGLAEVLSLTVTFLTATLLILAVAAAGVGRRGRLLAIAVAGTGVIAAVAAALFTSSRVGRVGVVWLALVVAAPIVALRRLMQHRSVTVETILGAISVYLLLAVAAAYLFLFIDTTPSGADLFFGERQPSTVFMYFSLVTVTSLGYGDFYPAGVFGRAAAAWESVIGQIYLVVVVARLVSLYSGGRLFPGRNDPPSAD
jgi:hypothetical protein